MIPEKHKGKQFIMCGTGPSLTPEVIELLRQYKNKYIIFGINDSYRAIDFLDEHYACDGRWWNVWGSDLRSKYPDLSCWCHENKGTEYKAIKINGAWKPDLSVDPKIIHFGHNSGYQALNIAFLMGGVKFILVGYNMQKVNNLNHYFGNHENGLKNNSPYDKFISSFDTISNKYKEMIVNCTTDSALKMFRLAELKDELESG